MHEPDLRTQTCRTKSTLLLLVCTIISGQAVGPGAWGVVTPGGEVPSVVVQPDTNADAGGDADCTAARPEYVEQEKAD